MPSSPDSAIVLGSDGFLGAHMVRILRARGWQVHPAGRQTGDLADPAIANACLAGTPHVDRIFHLVTRQRTGDVQYGIQGELLGINARIHLNVLEAWRLFQPQAKLVSTGSSCVYPESDRPIPEANFQTGPMHSSVQGYGLAKQLLAVGSEAYAAQYGLRFLHLILATVYGPADHKAPDRTHFMTGMIDRAVRERQQGHEELTVWGDPDTVRDLLYVDDQIEAMLAADAHFENERLNCSANDPVSIGRCAEALVEALRWNARIVYPAGTFKGTAYKTLDASRFLAACGWHPRVALRAGIEQTLRDDYGLRRD